MAKPVYTPQQIADQLTRSGLHWTKTTIAFSFPATAGGTTYAVDDTQKAWIREALNLIGDLVGLTFVEVAPGSASDIRFVNDNGGGTYASTSYYPSTGAIAGSTIVLDQTWSSNQSANISYGSYGFVTLLHETLHALGLSHPGSYNAGSGNPITYANSAEFEQDTHRYTVMSYFAAYEDGSGASHFFWTGSAWQWVYPQTPMVYDVMALTDGSYSGMFTGYAPNAATRAGDTVYGYNSTADRQVYDFTVNVAPVLTLYDSGGVDTLDLSGDSATRAIVPVYDASGNLTGWQDISSSYVRVIDLREGSYSSTHGLTDNLSIAFNTVIENAIGTNFADIIYGNDVANVLSGNAGNDELWGNGGNDTLIGGDGNDSLFGQQGDDILYGSVGADYLDGGANSDTLYGGLSDDTLIGGAGDDFLYGQQDNDTLYGSSGADRLDGGGGSDSLYGGLGNDILVGGAGDDFLYGQQDNDTLYGSSGADRLEGGGGDDLLYGGLDDDTLIGGSGDDSLYGQQGNDTVFGNTGADLIGGGAGNDVLYGGFGDDIINGDDGDDVLAGQWGNDILTGGPGTDTFVMQDGDGADIITDFEAGAGPGDVIDVKDFSFLTYQDLLAVITDTVDGALISLDADDSLLLQNVLKASLAEDDFLIA